MTISMICWILDLHVCKVYFFYTALAIFFFRLPFLNFLDSPLLITHLLNLLVIYLLIYLFIYVFIYLSITIKWHNDKKVTGNEMLKNKEELSNAINQEKMNQTNKDEV